MINLCVTFLFSALGINYLVTGISLETANYIVNKAVQPLFEGFNSALQDTAYSNNPQELIKKGYQLIANQLTIIPPDFHHLLNGGEYDCTKKEIIKLCNLVPIYTFYDRSNKNTYFANTLRERRLQRKKFRTFNKLIGYLAKTGHSCGASVGFVRTHYIDKSKKKFDIRVYLTNQLAVFKSQNKKQPKRYDHRFINNFVWGWPSKINDHNERINMVKNLYNQTIDGKPIDKTRICPGDLSEEVISEKDYEDDLPPVGNEIVESGRRITINSSEVPSVQPEVKVTVIDKSEEKVLDDLPEDIC